MSGQIPRPFASIALVATLLISGVGVTAPPTTGRADDCLTAPNSPAPQGSHWYYRLDRAAQRKCWYVRAPGQPAQQAAAPATTGPATPLHSTPAPSGTTPWADGAPMSLSPGDTAPPSPHVSVPPSPHVKISAVKPIPAPVPSGTTDKTVQQSAQEEITASTPEVPAPQASTLSETSPQAAAPLPDVARCPRRGCCGQGAGTHCIPTDALADSVSDDAEKTALRAEPTNDVGMSIIIFLLLAIGLAVVGIVSRGVVKNVAARRARIIIDRSEPNTVDDQRQHERRDDQSPYGSVLEGQELHSLVSAVSDPGPLRDDGGAFQITQEISKRWDKLAQLRQDINRMLQSSASPHEEPLRGRTAAVCSSFCSPRLLAKSLNQGSQRPRNHMIWLLTQLTVEARLLYASMPHLMRTMRLQRPMPWNGRTDDQWSFSSVARHRRVPEETGLRLSDRMAAFGRFW